MALTLVGIASLVAVVLAASAAQDETAQSSGPRRFEGSTLPRGLKAPDFALTDEAGRRVRMADFRGRPTVVTFLYTTCEDTCPGQAQVIKGAFAELGRDLPAVAVAVDPRATRPRARRSSWPSSACASGCASRWAAAPSCALVWKGFSVQPQRDDLEHTGRLVLVDAKGMQRVAFPIDQATPERVAHDLRLLDQGA